MTKQHITQKQLDELSDEQKKKLEKFLFNIYEIADDALAIMTIGQCIEFLGDDLRMIVNGNSELGKKSRIMERYQVIGVNQDWVEKELIDALWAAVKHKLKEQHE